jgi:PAS domain S-box-containing protein
MPTGNGECIGGGAVHGWAANNRYAPVLVQPVPRHRAAALARGSYGYEGCGTSSQAAPAPPGRVAGGGRGRERAGGEEQAVRLEPQAADRGTELILKTTRDGFLIVDLEGRIQEVNDALCGMLRYTRDELLALRVADVEAAESSEQIEAHIRRILEHGFDGFETRHRRKDGSLIDVQVSASVLRSEADTHVFAFIRDITAHKRAQEALRISEERYRLLVENSPTAIFVHESGGIFRYVNAAAVALFGVDSAEALLGRNYLEFVLPEERDAAAERVRQFTEAKLASGYVVRRIVRPSGEVRFASTIGIGFQEGERRLVQGMAQDITDGLRREQLLRESDAKFSAAFQGSVDPMCIVRTRDSLILEVNQAYEQLLGYPREELVGHTAAELGLTADPSQRAPMLDRLLSDGKVRDLRWVIRRKTGEVRETLHSAFLIAAEGEPRHVAIVRDLTELHRRERELRESEAKFSAAFHANVDAIVISRLSDGLILDVNEAYVLLTGYRREELIGRTTLELGIVADPDRRARRAEQAGKGGSLRDVPSPTRTRAGEIRDCLQTSYTIEIDGQPSWVSVLRDVTESRRAERALRQSEERLRQAVRVSDIGIFDHDHRTDTIYWSPEQRRIYGWGPDEPVTLQRFVACVHPEDLARIGADVQRAHDPAGDGRFDVEHRIIRRDGEVRWLTARSQTFFETEGNALHPVRTVGAVVDITERKRVEEAIRHSESLLAEAQRTAHLGNFERDLVTGNAVWSDETYRLLGCQPGSVVPRMESVLQVVHPDDRERFVAAYERSMKPESGGHYEVEHRVLLPDGSERILRHRATVTFDQSGRPVRIFGTSQDITEARRAEQELRLAATAFESHEGIFITDSKGIILRVNRAFTKITGYPAHEVVGCPASLLNSDQHDSVFSPTVWGAPAALAAGKARSTSAAKTGSYIRSGQASPR